MVIETRLVIVSLKPKISEKFNAFCLASELNKRNPPDRTSDIPSFFRYKH